MPVCLGLPTRHHTTGSTLQTAHPYSRSVPTFGSYCPNTHVIAVKKKQTNISAYVSHYCDCDWLADLIEGAPEVATVNPLAERLKQGAGKHVTVK